MAKAALDPLVHLLFTQAVPFLILAGVVGLLAGSLFRWLEQSTPRAIHAHRGKRPRPVSRTCAIRRDNESVPDCAMCDVPMVKRIARRGPRAGAPFWGCANYPMCRSTREISES